jgi:hypothetical protein
MPRGDGTGPAGQGPMTGRRAGFCAGYDMPGFANAAPGYGYGRGYGGGWARGWRHRNWFYATGLPRWARWGGTAPWAPPAYAPPTREQELGELKQQAEWLKDQLDAISKRMAELNEE